MNTIILDDELAAKAFDLIFWQEIVNQDPNGPLSAIQKAFLLERPHTGRATSYGYMRVAQLRQAMEEQSRV